jgi:ABC-type multidrug transport system fused ATPase/permease subunit
VESKHRSGSFQIVLAFISLYSLMGVYGMWQSGSVHRASSISSPGLAGVAVMLLSMPANALVARMSTRLQKRQMKSASCDRALVSYGSGTCADKDERTRLMSEIRTHMCTRALSCSVLAVQSSRVIKLYAWESYFTERLLAIRNGKELPTLRKIGYLNSLGTCLWNVVPFLVAFTSFAVYATYSGQPLTSQIVFPALSLFQLVCAARRLDFSADSDPQLSFPLAVLPAVISSAIEAFVSAQRLRDFLSANELQKDAIEIVDSPEPLKLGDELITISKADFSWNEKATVPTLSDVDLVVKKGELTAVVGRVGSGKSSLLAAVLVRCSAL